MSLFAVAAALAAAAPLPAQAHDAPTPPAKMECCEKMKDKACACCAKQGGEHAGHDAPPVEPGAQPSGSSPHNH